MHQLQVDAAGADQAVNDNVVVADQFDGAVAANAVDHAGVVGLQGNLPLD